MKARCTILALILMIMGSHLQSQSIHLPYIDLYKLDGSRINASGIDPEDSILVLIFWSISNKNSLEQLMIIDEEYKESMISQKVKIIGICTDINGTDQQVKPLVYANDIGFDIYIDRNNDFKRAMNVSDDTFLIIKYNMKDSGIRLAGLNTKIGDIVHNETIYPIASAPELK